MTCLCSILIFPWFSRLFPSILDAESPMESSSSGARRVCRVRPGGARRQGAAREAAAGAAVSHPSLSAARRRTNGAQLGKGEGLGRVGWKMADLHGFTMVTRPGKLTKNYWKLPLIC